ncbi:hypothetical protein D9619_006522 [Psilocybe cf. subviscida]|uniref:Possible tRNA binding domain-containing protein n=1 Tax=Psilocybe cf. subviscida TaxID=2480587 RepID=A0A8H5B532_9AGAR|nr:hypothetical protein D9619_006522 [Psilocybe cf. subviscida]
MFFTPFDLKRLESYANNMLDYHVILDLLPTITNIIFQQRLSSSSRTGDPQDGAVWLSALRSSILLARELDIPASQALALFAKLLRKVSKRLIDIRKAVIST